MKIKEEKRNKEIIDYVVDLYSSSGKVWYESKRKRFRTCFRKS
jgi:hypothetical protein